MDIQQQIDNLQKQLDNFKNYATIPYEVAEAFKARIIPNTPLTGEVLTGTPPTQPVNEAGAATYTVSGPFTGKIGIFINGTEYTVPTV